MKKTLLTIALMTMIFGVINSASLKWTFSFGMTEMRMSEFNGNYIPNIEGGRNYFEPGSPCLPSKTLYFSLPSTSRLINVKLTNEVWEDAGTYEIMPTQRTITFGTPFVFTEPSEKIYSENSYYPSSPVTGFGTGNKSGFMIAHALICPFRYNPVTEQLQVLVSADVELNYQEGLEELVFLSGSQRDFFMGDIKNLVLNPEELNKNAPLIRQDRFPSMQYVIVTPQALAADFQPIIEWKIERGVSAAIFTKEWIVANYTGYDDMEKIREFVKDYHQNHGLVYLVMAGDDNNLGARLGRISAGGSTESPPTDLYFSDVVPYSSDWDANNNHIFGERTGDGCDWYSDVYVGRFPVNTSQEAQRWVNKLLAYEKNPPTGFIQRSLQGGAGLWPNQNYYGDRVCDSIADNHLPAWWTHTKMYETSGGHPNGFADSLSHGYGWCHMAGHGNEDGVYWYASPDNMLTSTLSTSLTNGMKLGIVHSIACIPGHFDNYECMAEYLFNAPNGGAIAIMLNARYGWGNPPSFGPSEWIDVWTAGEVFDDENWNIGAGHGLGKDHIISGMDEYDHWCLIELNLFGDPETQIYSREPVSMSVSHPAVIPLGSGNINITVSTAKAPVEGAVCCISRTSDTTTWFVDTTDASGNVSLAYSLTSADPVKLTVYAHDCRYYQDTLPVVSTGVFVSFAGINSLTGGHGNSQVNPGCSYQIKVNAANYGSQNAAGVKGILTSSDPNINVSSDTFNFGNIPSHDTVTSQNELALSISNNVEDGYLIPLTLLCFDSNDSSWTSNFSLTVNSPEVSVTGYYGPAEIMPGDVVEFGPMLNNEGSGTAYTVQTRLRCISKDPYVTINDSAENFSQLNSGDSVKLRTAFNVTISASCPTPYFPEFELYVQGEGGYTYSDTFSLGVGSVVFNEDFEGANTWTYSGPTCWHVTTRRSHSATHSMFSGNETGNYSNNITNARAISPQFTVGSGVEMTFWHYYVIESEWDGCHVQVSTNGGSTWSLLTPDEGYTDVSNGNSGFSSGDPIYSGSHPAWELQHIQIPVSGNVNLCWRFGSDTYVAYEGYYFDDVQIGVVSGLGVEEQENPVTGPVVQFALMRAYPNPVRGRAVIGYSVGAEVSVRLAVYDISGREVTELVNCVQGPGVYRVEWDGRDERGSLVSSGTYFYRIVAGSFQDANKIVVVR